MAQPRFHVGDKVVIANKAPMQDWRAPQMDQLIGLEGEVTNCIEYPREGGPYVYRIYISPIVEAWYYPGDSLVLAEEYHEALASTMSLSEFFTNGMSRSKEENEIRKG